MDWMRLPRSLVLVPVLALPAWAQEPLRVPGPPGSGPMMNPDANSVVPSLSTPTRPGLFGWRRRHAEWKSHLQEKALGYPEEFNEWPLGWALYSHGRTEVANGAAAGLVLNHYDFIGETTEMNYRGQDKLAAIAAKLPTCFAPLIIERTPWAPEIAEARRLAIVNKLAEGPFPVPAERVVVEPAVARGISGIEAFIVNTNRINSLQERGSASVGFTGRMAIPRP